MEIIRPAFDWLLIISSTYVLIRCTNRFLMKPGASLGNYVILIVWIFCVLPILLDYLVGRPTYQTVYWYQPFIKPMEDDEVSSIYDTLIFISMYALYFYCNSHERKGKATEVAIWNTALAELKPLVFLVVVSPLLFIVVSGLTPYFLMYGDSGTRGMPEGSNTMVTALLLLSIIAFCTWFFKRVKLRGRDVLLLLVYSFLVAWISGKRFMIALLILLYVYFLLNRDVSNEVRKRLKLVLPLVLIALFAFSAFYLVGVRPLSDTSATSVYEMLRVDFGRDDVTKYVIYHEFFLDDHILDYPGQTFLSTFLVWVPRIIWPGKPFQHYQYLTSSILGLPIAELPAGTTPCWFEMCLANFSYIGYAIAILGLNFLIWLCDKAKTVSTRAVAMVLLVALMTQSVDAYSSLVLLLVAQFLLGVFIRKRDELRGATHRGGLGIHAR